MSGTGAVSVMYAALKASLPAVLILAVAALCGVAGNLIQHGFLWAPHRLAPEFSKVDPLQGLKRLFGMDNLINFLKSLLKLFAVCAIVWFVIKPRIGALSIMPALGPAAILPYSAEVLRALLYAVLAFTAVLAGLDWFVARQRYMARMRMTREEVKQDQRDSEGDPHVKGKQKQLRMAAARRRMIQNVPKATVVVTNPTHYAVAIRYHIDAMVAPLVVAKGKNYLALRIREKAILHGVPIVENPPLARALYANVEIDREIPPEHYKAVAEIIGYVFRLKGKMRPQAAR